MITRQTTVRLPDAKQGEIKIEPATTTSAEATLIRQGGDSIYLDGAGEIVELRDALNAYIEARS